MGNKAMTARDEESRAVRRAEYERESAERRAANLAKVNDCGIFGKKTWSEIVAIADKIGKIPRETTIKKAISIAGVALLLKSAFPYPEKLSGLRFGIGNETADKLFRPDEIYANFINKRKALRWFYLIRIDASYELMDEEVEKLSDLAKGEPQKYADDRHLDHRLAVLKCLAG